MVVVATTMAVVLTVKRMEGGDGKHGEGCACDAGAATLTRDSRSTLQLLHTTRRSRCCAKQVKRHTARPAHRQQRTTAVIDIMTLTFMIDIMTLTFMSRG